MNERQLYYFIVTAEERNLGRAAERLPLSLSALSRQIQSLEEELGAKLFIRNTSGVYLTAAGEALLQHARSLKSQFELVKNDIQIAATAVEQKINIGAYGSALLTHIPNIIKLFRKNHPTVEVALHSAQISQQFDNLLKGVVQIVFDRHFLAPEELLAELVHEEDICLALHADHPLAQLDRIDLSDLRDIPMIGRLKNNFSNEWIELFSQHGFQPNIIQRTQDMASAVSMVSVGLGVAFVPESFQSLSIPNVVYRPLTAPVNLHCDLYCYYRSNDKSRALQWILETVHEFRNMHSKKHQASRTNE